MTRSRLFDDIHNPRLSSLVGAESPAAQGERATAVATDQVRVTESCAYCAAPAVALSRADMFVCSGHSDMRIDTPIGLTTRFAV